MKIVRIGFLSKYYWEVHPRDIMMKTVEIIPSFRFMKKRIYL